MHARPQRPHAYFTELISENAPTTPVQVDPRVKGAASVKRFWRPPKDNAQAPRLRPAESQTMPQGTQAKTCTASARCTTNVIKTHLVRRQHVRTKATDSATEICRPCLGACLKSGLFADARLRTLPCHRALLLVCAPVKKKRQQCCGNPEGSSLPLVVWDF